MPVAVKGQRFGGRQKGTLNKKTVSIRAAFTEAFEKLGGAEALAKWARRNKTEFYKLASKAITSETAAPLIPEEEMEALRQLAAKHMAALI